MYLTKEQEEKIKILIETCKPCIIVTPRIRYDDKGRRYSDGFTIIGESSEKLGHSHGVGWRYDFGFMGLDTENGISVIILN